MKNKQAVARMKRVPKGKHWYRFDYWIDENKVFDYRHWVGLKEAYPLPF